MLRGFTFRDKPNSSWFQTFTVFCTLYVFFWVIPRRLNFMCRRFGTLCLFHPHRQVGKEWLNLRMVGVSIWEMVWLKNSLSQLEAHHPPSNRLKLFSSQTLSHMDTPTILKFSHYLPTCLWRWNRQCSEMSAYKIQMPGELPRRKHATDQSLSKLQCCYTVYTLPNLLNLECNHYQLPCHSN